MEGQRWREVAIVNMTSELCHVGHMRHPRHRKNIVSYGVCDVCEREREKEKEREVGEYSCHVSFSLSL